MGRAAGRHNRLFVIRRLSTGQYYAGRRAPRILRGGRTTHTFTKNLAHAIRYQQHPLRIIMPKLLRIFWRDLQALDSKTLEPFEKWRVKKGGTYPQAPPTRCSHCHRPMQSLSSYDASCECGGSIEAQPQKSS